MMVNIFSVSKLLKKIVGFETFKIILASSCYAKMSSLKQLKRERSYFGSQLERYGPLWWGVVTAGREGTVVSRKLAECI